MDVGSTNHDSRLQNSLKVAGQEAQHEESLYLLELVTSATHDEKPEYTLAEIYHNLLIVKSFNLLDALNLIPLLLASEREGASELFQLIGKEGNAKEVILAVQEALDRIERDDDETSQSSTNQVLHLLNVCKDAIPRLQLRKKGPRETLAPVLEHFRSISDSVMPHAEQDEGRNVIFAASEMAASIFPWIVQNKQLDDDSNKTVDLLSDFLYGIVGTCSDHIQACLAERRFQLCNSRFILKSGLTQTSERGFMVMQQVTKTADLLGINPDNLISFPPSLGKLVILAHRDPSLIPSDDHYLEALIPLFTFSFNQNAATDESLALLTTILNSSSYQLPSEAIDHLVTLLTPFASNHPIPNMRYIAFRILSKLLSLSPPPVHLANIMSLLSDCPYPQMRVAAVGLVKEAFLTAISSNGHENSPFRTNTFIRALGPILFRPDPPDLFVSPDEDTLRKFLESSEPARLTECLSFYYVLLMRDTQNLTGIRDKDMLKTVENGLMSPIRKALTTWLKEDTEDARVLMALGSLQTSIERIDDAVSSVSF